MTKTLRHIDRADLASPERTEEGYLKLEGVVATPGVLVYWRDGEAVCEYVPAETLRDPDYLESLNGKPVCVEHPDGERIGPDNVRMLEVGTSFDNRWVDGTGHCATFLIKAPEGIDAYENGCRELSPAYDVRLQEQPGIHEGQSYEYVQAKRRAGNHIAMTSQGRGGRRASFHTDSYVRSDASAPPTDTTTADDPPSGDSQTGVAGMSDDKTMHQVELNGRSVPMRADQADVVQRYKRDQEETQMELSSELESARDQIKEFKSEIEELEGQLDKKKSQLEVMRKELGLGAGEMPEMGEGEEGDGEMGDEPADATDEGMPAEDEGDYDTKEDAFMAWRKDRARHEDVAKELGVEDVAEMRSDALKEEIVEAYHGEDSVDASRLDSQVEAIAEVVEAGAKKRDDSYKKLSERADDAKDSGRDTNERRTGAWAKARTR